MPRHPPHVLDEVPRARLAGNEWSSPDEGDAGPGLRRAVRTAVFASIRDDALQTYFARCEAGEQAVGGSFSKTDPVHGDAFDCPDPIAGTPTGWAVGASTANSTMGDGKITIYAVSRSDSRAAKRTSQPLSFVVPGSVCGTLRTAAEARQSWITAELLHPKDA